MQNAALLEDLAPLCALISQAIVADPPANLSGGGVIAPNYSAELDSITHASRNAKDWVAALEKSERERSGIKSLKVGYNRVFGYYIEISTVECAASARRLYPQTNADQRRALYHAGTQRIRSVDFERRRASGGARNHSIPRLVWGNFAIFHALIKTAQQLAELDVYSALAKSPFASAMSVPNSYTRVSSRFAADATRSSKIVSVTNRLCPMM